MTNYRFVAVLFLGLAIIACAPKNDQQNSENLNAIQYDLRVSHDTLFEMGDGQVVGTSWFSESFGLIGLPVSVVIKLSSDSKNKSLFEHKVFHGAIKLLNPELTTLDSYVREFDYDYDADIANGVKLTLIMPQVTTVPATLDYDVRINYQEEGSTDYFEAFCVYQYIVDQGQPATPH